MSERNRWIFLLLGYWSTRRKTLEMSNERVKTTPTKNRWLLVNWKRKLQRNKTNQIHLNWPRNNRTCFSNSSIKNNWSETVSEKSVIHRNRSVIRPPIFLSVRLRKMLATCSNYSLRSFTAQKSNLFPTSANSFNRFGQHCSRRWHFPTHAICISHWSRSFSWTRKILMVNDSLQHEAKDVYWFSFQAMPWRIWPFDWIVIRRTCSSRWRNGGSRKPCRSPSNVYCNACSRTPSRPKPSIKSRLPDSITVCRCSKFVSTSTSGPVNSFDLS